MKQRMAMELTPNEDSAPDMEMSIEQLRAVRVAVRAALKHPKAAGLSDEGLHQLQGAAKVLGVSIGSTHGPVDLDDQLRRRGITVLNRRSTDDVSDLVLCRVPKGVDSFEYVIWRQRKDDGSTHAGQYYPRGPGALTRASHAFDVGRRVR